METIGREEKNIILAIDPAEIEAFAASIKQRRQHLNDLVTELEPMVPAEEHEAFAEFKDLVTQYLAKNDQIQDWAKANTQAVASAMSRMESAPMLGTTLAPLTLLAKAMEEHVKSADVDDEVRGAFIATKMMQELREIQKLENEIIDPSVGEAAAERKAGQIDRIRSLVDEDRAALGKLDVTWQLIDGGNVINDAMLAGALDIAGTGAPGFVTLWAKARGIPRSEIIGVCGMSTCALALNTNRAEIKSLAGHEDAHGGQS